MTAVIFGASGMVGQGVLRECLLDPEVTRVVAVVRSPGPVRHAKLEQIAHQDFLDFTAIEERLAGLDACFFCLGVTSAGMTEQAYRRVTVDITQAALTAVLRVNPGIPFVFISGMGADNTGKSRVMWARAKGDAENLVLNATPKGIVIRPAAIVPLHGIASRTKLYRIGYSLARPLLPVLRKLLPGQITTTEELGKVMIRIAKHGARLRLLESRDIGQVV